jgi:hypothetical protein
MAQAPRRRAAYKSRVETCSLLAVPVNGGRVRVRVVDHDLNISVLRSATLPPLVFDVRTAGTGGAANGRGGVRPGHSLRPPRTDE